MADTACKMVSKLRCLRVLLLSPVALQSCSRNVQGTVGVMPSFLCRKFHLSAPVEEGKYHYLKKKTLMRQKRKEDLKARLERLDEEDRPTGCLLCPKRMDIEINYKYILGYSPPDKIFKMAAFCHCCGRGNLSNERRSYSGLQTQNPPVWLILKQLSPSVPVPSENVRLLSQFVSPHSGRIYGRKITGLCDRKQKEVAGAIRRARAMGFMPVTMKYLEYHQDPKLF